MLVGLQSVNPQYFKDGVLISKEEYEQRLAAQGMTLQDGWTTCGATLMLVKVKNMVYASILVPDKEVLDEYRRQKERVTIEYIAFLAGQVSSRYQADRRRNFTRCSRDIMRSISRRKNGRSRC